MSVSYCCTIPRMKTKQFRQSVNNQGVTPQVLLHVAQLAQEEKLPMEEALSLKTSLQIKAAEYWLKLGEADQALRELEALPSRIWNHSWALKTRIAAVGV